MSTQARLPKDRECKYRDYPERFSIDEVIARLDG